MSPRVTLATARRVGAQLRRDPRTLALIFVVPPALIALLKFVFDEQPQSFERIGAPLVGLFPLVLMFLITSIAMLRERTTGTLERLMSMPLAKLDLLAGYGLAFAVVAAVQGAVTAGVAFGLLGLDTAGPVWAVVALAIGNAVVGMALGLFLSAFARSEFQAVQFMPAFILPSCCSRGCSSRASACRRRCRRSLTACRSPTPTRRSPRSPSTTSTAACGSTSG
jgi:ABC-2 type transport system permease protein